MPDIYYSTDTFHSRNWHLAKPYMSVPLPVAVEVAELVTEACRWFHEPRALFLGDPSAPAIPDDVVDEVCRALQYQLDKEGKSRTADRKGKLCGRHGVMHTDWYQVMDLPAARRRALVDRIWAIKAREQVTVPVYPVGVEVAPPPAHSSNYWGMG